MIRCHMTWHFPQSRRPSPKSELHLQVVRPSSFHLLLLAHLSPWPLDPGKLRLAPLVLSIHSLASCYKSANAHTERLFYKQGTMSTPPPSLKRRRIDPSSTLSKPFKSPLKSSPQSSTPTTAPSPQPAPTPHLPAGPKAPPNPLTASPNPLTASHPSTTTKPPPPQSQHRQHRIQNSSPSAASTPPSSPRSPPSAPPWTSRPKPISWRPATRIPSWRR